MRAVSHLLVPDQVRSATLLIRGREVELSNLNKLFFPKLKLTKRDLLQYYADLSPYLLPHVKGRAEVMKRYPNGVAGEFFYMKRTPDPHPKWLQTCKIRHPNAGWVPYPVLDDVASLLWMVNLGCVDLNPWYASCGGFDHPEFLHFDLDPVEGVNFNKVREVALRVRDHLADLGMPSLAKTTGATGMHIYVPIVPNHIQKEVWYVAKAIAMGLAKKFPKTITAEYRIANRPRGTVLVDYNQNAWGKTLASVYSVRPVADACVSAPVNWKEVEDGVDRKDFTILNMLKRVHEVGDLWKPMLAKKRYDLSPLIEVARRIAA